MSVQDIVDQVLAEQSGETVMLSFSRGKDAWGVWCALRDKVDIQPFHYYVGPPGLTFIQESLDYAERKMGKHIISVPAPVSYGLFSSKGFVAQPPNRIVPLAYLNFPVVTFEQVQDAVAKDAKLPPDTFTALGVRAADSARRALFFKTHPPVSLQKKKFYPIWDWNKDKLLEELKRNDVHLPIDYKIFGRSYDGLYYMYLAKIKQYFPEDYKKILEYYPLIDLEIYRHEKRLGL